MGRSNTLIFGFGLFACVALSLAMKHAVTVKDNHREHAIVDQVHLIFGDRLEDVPQIAFENVNGKKLAVLTLRPKRPASGRSLARLIGMLVWRMKGDEIRFDALDVLLKKNANDVGERITIAPLTVVPRSHKPGTKTTRGKAKPVGKRPANHEK